MKKLLFCCVLWCGLIAHAQQPQTPTHMVITEQSGYSVSILLTDKPKITFESEVLWNFSTLQGTTYKFFNKFLSKIHYLPNPASIEDIILSNDEIKRRGELLCFFTSKPNTLIMIADMKGHIIFSRIINTENYNFPLSHLSSGTYIAKINDTTIKFIKQ